MRERVIIFCVGNIGSVFKKQVLYLTPVQVGLKHKNNATSSVVSMVIISKNYWYVIFECSLSYIHFTTGWALKRGFRTAKAARLDSYRAANNILRMALDGKIALCLHPPNFSSKTGRINLISIQNLSVFD